MIDLNKIIIPDSSDPNYWAAEMTKKQFQSLAKHLDSADLIEESYNLDFFQNRLSQSANFEQVEVVKWLRNSWNTELVLKGNRTLIEPGNSFPLQWAFPQAYYSVFASTLALYKVCGYTQTTHASVLKHFGTLISQGKYPSSLNFYCDGPKNKITYHGIVKPLGHSSMAYDESSDETIANQICQFLKSTREIQLDERSKAMKIKNGDGVIKKRLNSGDWESVSSSTGITSILNLLYRKRIKANYRDIETFTYAGIDGGAILDSLISIVGSLNLINETFIAKAVGLEVYNNIKDSALKGIKQDFINGRYNKSIEALR